MGSVEAGWTFTGWSGGNCSGTAPCTVAITGNTEVTANFSQIEYSLTVSIDPPGSGNSVTLSNPGPVYHYNDPVTLTPVTVVGWRFDHWMVGETSGTDNPLNLNITGNMVVTAYFTQIPYTLTVNSAHGTVTKVPDQATYTYGADVVLTMGAVDPGWTFTGWSGGGCTGTDPCTVDITADTTVTADFTQNLYTLNITIDPLEMGTVDKSPDQTTYTYGQVVTLTASGVPGWSFAGWTGACSGNGDCLVTMNDNKAVTATFTRDEYVLDINIIGNGTVANNPDHPTYLYGDAVVLTATPASGWEVSEWSVEGCTGNTCTVTMYGDQSVTVTFTSYTVYSLTTSVDGNGSISKDPDLEAYPRDTMVTLIANPGPGSFFDHWTGDCAGRGNPCILTMDSNKSVTAYFTLGLSLPQNLINSPGTVLEGFESMTGWTVSGSGSGYSAVLDTTYVKEGAASIRLTTPASGNVTITKPVSWNLSASQGNFRFWVYVSGTSEPTGGSIMLSSDASYSNYFITSYGSAFKLRYKPGWNLINLQASDWKAGKGSPSWSNIVSIRIRLDSRSVNTYSFDALTNGVVAQPAVIFTFDKGLSSLYSQAFAYMQSHNVRGTGYIPTNLVGNTGQASWAQLLTMYNAGWTIGNYTMAGTSLAGLTQPDQIAVLSGARDALNVGLGLPVENRTVDYVAYPGGTYDANTLAAMNSLGMRIRPHSAGLQ